MPALRAVLLSLIAPVLIAPVLIGPLLGALGASPARADFISAPDVVVYCDPTLAAALRAVSRVYRAQTGVPVRVLAAPGPLSVELIAHGTRNDVLVTQADWLDGAAARRLVDPSTRSQAWLDPTVLAGREATPAAAVPEPAALMQPAFMQAGLEQALAGGKLGVIDPTQPGGPDGPALAGKLGWQVPLAGEIDGPGVAFLVATGAARLGLLPRSAALAPPGLVVLATLPEAAAPPVRYAAAVSKNIQSRNAAPFMAFLRTAPAQDALRAAGLEIEP